MTTRRALVAAAVEIFGEHGYDAPLSAVAKRAGVGQGSLYRHFPDRADLALAVFDHDVTALEALLERPDVGLGQALELITDQIVASVAFVEVIAAGPPDARLTGVTDRVREVLAVAGARAHDIRPPPAVRDLMLAIGMVAALVAKVPRGQRRETADRAWELLDRGLWSLSPEGGPA